MQALEPGSTSLQLVGASEKLTEVDDIDVMTVTTRSSQQHSLKCLARG